MIEVLRDGVAKVIKSETIVSIAKLDEAWESLPVEAIHEVRAHRDLMVPVLIDGLRKATLSAQQGHDLEGNGPFFGPVPVTELDAQEALPAIVEACSLPEVTVNNLLGEDLFLGPFTAMLAKLARHDWDSIEKLVANKGLPYYTRWASAQAYSNLVRDGYMPREEVIRRVEPHLKVAISERDVDLTTGFVVVTEFVGTAREAMETIRCAFQKKLWPHSLSDWMNWSPIARKGEAMLAKRLGQLRPSGIKDVIEELSRWTFGDAEEDLVPNKRPIEFPLVEGRLAVGQRSKGSAPRPQ